MSSYINLFGLQLSVEDVPELAPRPSWVTDIMRWNTSISNQLLSIDIHIVIDYVWFLELKGEFTIGPSALDPKKWIFLAVPDEGLFKFTYLKGRESTNPDFELRAAWISSSRNSSIKTAFKILIDGYLGIVMPKVPFHTTATQYPIESYSTGEQALTLLLDPDNAPSYFNANKRSIWFDEKCFETKTFIKTAIPSPNNRMFEQTWISGESILIALSDLGKNQSIHLIPKETDVGYLAFHCFKWDSSQDYSPSIGINAPMIVMRMNSYHSLGPAGKISIPSGTIECYALHENNDNTLTWSFTDAQKPLRVSYQRLSGMGSLASFSVDPFHQGKNSLNLSRVSSNSDMYVKGIRSGVRFKIGDKATLEVNRIGPDATSGGPVIRPKMFEQFNYTKAGNAYLAGNDGTAIDTWTMKGSNGVLPCLTDEAANQEAGFSESYFEAINKELRNYKDKTREITHESAMVMGKAINNEIVSMQRLLVDQEAPVLSKFKTDYEYGYVRFTHTWESAEIADHFIITEQNALDIIKSFDLDQKNVPNQEFYASDSKPSGLDTRDGSKVYAVVKLGRGKTLSEILRSANVLPEEIKSIIDLVPSLIESREWVGCILFRQKLELENFPLLNSLIDIDGGLSLHYLALSPNRLQNQGDDAFSVYSRVLYENKTEPVEHPDDKNIGDDNEPRKEVLMQTRKVDITWADRQLAAFHVETIVRIRTCFGRRKNLNGEFPEVTQIDIIGAVDRETETIRFLARSDKPVPLLPDEGFGPIKQVWAKRLEIVRLGSKTKVDVDGDIDFQSLGWGGTDWFEGVDGIDFQGFGFSFPKLSREGSWLDFDYPSFRLRLGRGGHELLGLSSLKLKLKSLGIDFPDSGFDWSASLPVLSGDWNWDNMRKIAGRFRLGLEMFKLPMLSGKPFDTLKFDFDIGIPFSKDDINNIDWSKLRLHISAVGFKRLNLELMRFLSLRAESVSLTAKEFPQLPGIRVPWISLRQVELDVLDKPIIKDMDFDFFSVPDGKKGFLGILKQKVDLGILQIKWVIIGKEIVIPDDFAKAIISIRSDWEDNLDEKLRNAYNNNQLVPLGLVNGRPIGDWLFAAGLDVLYGALSGKFLFQDNAYYGIALEGDLLNDWFGYDFGIAVLYIQRDRPEEDAFYIEFRVPLVSMGAIAIKGGIIALEIQMNGGFLLDIGFPWLENGIRNWDRTPGAYLSGLMGKGGMYIAKRKTVREILSNKGKLTMFAAGQAMMIGIGGAYSRGPFRVEAWAGVYIVGEGAILVRRLEVMGLRVVGSVGIQVRGVGELNWWIISIRIEVIIGAEARLTLNWGIEFNPVTGDVALPNSNAPNKRIVVQLDFNLYARVSAQACIGKGWFKVCKGISTGVSLPYRQRLILGE